MSSAAMTHDRLQFRDGERPSGETFSKALVTEINQTVIFPIVANDESGSPQTADDARIRRPLHCSTIVYVP